MTGRSFTVPAVRGTAFTIGLGNRAGTGARHSLFVQVAAGASVPGTVGNRFRVSGSRFSPLYEGNRNHTSPR